MFIIDILNDGVRYQNYFYKITNTAREDQITKNSSDSLNFKWNFNCNLLFYSMQLKDNWWATDDQQSVMFGPHLTDPYCITNICAESDSRKTFKIFVS